MCSSTHELREKPSSLCDSQGKGLNRREFIAATPYLLWSLQRLPIQLRWIASSLYFAG